MNRITYLKSLVFFSSFIFITAFSATTFAITIQETETDTQGLWQVSISAPELPFTTTVIDADGSTLIDSDDFIIGFAIGNDIATSAFSNYVDWNADLLNEAEWGGTMLALQGALTSVAATDGATINFDAANIDWGSAFPEYDQAILYSWDIFFDYDNFDYLNATNLPIGPIFGDTTYDEFYFESVVAASPYVVFVANCDPTTGNCAITAQTGQTIHAIPEPTVFALLAIGFAGLFGVKGKIRKFRFEKSISD